MGHRADRHQIVLHGKVDIARSDEPPFPLAAVIAVFHGTDGRVLGYQTRPTACAEVGEDAASFKQPLSFVIGLVIKFLVIESPCLFVKHIKQL